MNEEAALIGSAQTHRIQNEGVILAVDEDSAGTEIVRSTNVCSSVAGSQVTKIIRAPARRARVSAPRTNCVMPLAETPMTMSRLVGRSRVIDRAPSS